MKNKINAILETTMVFYDSDDSLLENIQYIIFSLFVYSVFIGSFSGLIFCITKLVTL